MGRVKISFDRNTRRDRCVTISRRGNRYLGPSPPICTGKVHTRSGLSLPRAHSKFTNESWKWANWVGWSRAFKETVILSKKKKHRVGPRLVRWRCSTIPWKNWSIEIGTRNEISIVFNRKEKEKWNFSTNISLFSQGSRKNGWFFLTRNITCKNNFSSFFPAFLFSIFPHYRFISSRNDPPPSFRYSRINSSTL